VDSSGGFALCFYYLCDGNLFCFQGDAGSHVLRNDAALDDIQLVPLGPWGIEKVDSEVYSTATSHDAAARGRDRIQRGWPITPSTSQSILARSVSGNAWRAPPIMWIALPPAVASMPANQSA
jgi:hypothetical protein